MEPKRMEAVEVYVNEYGNICIQNDNYGDGREMVFFSPDQVDTIIDWLKEAKEIALNMEKKS